MTASEIDEALIANVGQRWRKVAMVLALAAEQLASDNFDLLAERLQLLVAGGQLEAQGDLSRWRHSEVRLAA